MSNNISALRTTLFDNMLSIDVAAFYIDWNNVQILTSYVSQPSGQRYNVIGNGGKARSQGGEVTLRYQPVSAFTLGLNAGYTDAKLTSAAPARYQPTAPMP